MRNQLTHFLSKQLHLQHKPDIFPFNLVKFCLHVDNFDTLAYAKIMDKVTSVHINLYKNIMYYKKVLILELAIDKYSIIGR